MKNTRDIKEMRSKKKLLKLKLNTMKTHSTYDPGLLSLKHFYCTNNRKKKSVKLL